MQFAGREIEHLCSDNFQTYTKLGAFVGANTTVLVAQSCTNRGKLPPWEHDGTCLRVHAQSLNIAFLPWDDNQ